MTGTIEVVEDHGTVVGIVIDGRLLCGNSRMMCNALLSIAPDGDVVGTAIEYDLTDYGALEWIAPLGSDLEE